MSSMNIKLDETKKYYCYNHRKSSGFTMLMRMVMKIRKYPHYDALIKYIDENKNELNKKNDIGLSAFMLAAINSNGKSTELCVEILIAAKCDVNCLNDTASSALLCILYKGDKDSENIIEMIIKAGCDVNRGNNLSMYPLNVFIEKFHDLGILKILIEYGCDLNCKNINDRTPLMNAISNNKMNIAKILIDNGCDVNCKDRFNETALMIAIHCGNIDAIKCLIDCGCDINLSNHNNNALLSAILFNNVEIIKLLVDHGCDLNYTLASGNSALLKAVEYSRIDTVKILIDGGCNLNLKNLRNQTAFTMCNDIKILDLLIDKNVHVDSEQMTNIEYLKKEKLEYYSEYNIRKYIKRNNYLNTIRYIPKYIEKFRLKYGTVTQKIVIYNMKLKYSDPIVIFNQIKLNDPIILEYLCVRSVVEINRLTLYVDYLMESH